MGVNMKWYEKPSTTQALILLALLVAMILFFSFAAHAQFIGYVGLQTNYTKVVTTSVIGRFPVNANIGASYHTFTYCVPNAVATLELFIAETPDGNANNDVQISPIYSFPTGFTSSGSQRCGIMRVGGYYSVLAVHIFVLTGGSVTVWYTSTAGPVDVNPPFVGSGGATSGVECDQSITFTDIPTGTTQVVLNTPPFQATYICGGTISFGSNTTRGAIFLTADTAPSLPTDCPALTPSISRRRPATPATPKKDPPAAVLTMGGKAFVPLLYNVDITANSPQLFAMNSAPNTFFFVPPEGSGTNICFATGSIGATTTLTLNYAQF